MQNRVRHSISATVLVTVLGALTVGAARSDDVREIVVASWGGAFTKATSENLVVPFSQEKGITYKIADASGQHLAQVEAQTAAHKITWDVVDSIGQATATLMYQRGLVETIPPEVKAVLEKNSAPGMVTDFGIMQSSIASPFICNKEKVKACPKNAAEYFDVDHFPGSRSAYNDPYYMLVLALDVLGVGDRAPNADEIDKAFALIQKVRPSIRTLWESADQSAQLMRSEEAVIMVIWNRIARRLVEENATKYEVSWSHANYAPAYDVVVKGAPHKELAFQYLEWYATHPANQAKWSSATSYGVASPEALKSVDPEAAKWLPESHLDEVVGPKNGWVNWWVQNKDSLVKRWREIISG